MSNDLPADRKHQPPRTHTQAEVDAFIERLVNLAPATCGRVIFALDATASRQPTWDTACMLQAEMFRETATIGGLDVQLVYYRGESECEPRAGSRLPTISPRHGQDHVRGRPYADRQSARARSSREPS